MKYISLILLFAFCSVTASTNSGGSEAKRKNINGEQNSAAQYLILAQSLISQQRFEEAAQAYRDYVLHNPDADAQYYSEVIDLLLRDDSPVEIKNIGGNINSASSDIFPRISSDGKTLYFISKKIGGFGGDDSWYSKKDGSGNWGPSVNFGKSLNTSTHEGILAISSDDQFAIVFGNYGGSFGSGDLFYIVRRGDRWTLPCNLGGTINSNSWESMANLAPDGKSLLFTSDRSGGQGDEDIYVATLTENGWTMPLNLGAVINTSGAEKYPFLSADGKTLYFSSNTHPGLGGQDLFYSKRMDDSWTNWSKPVNLGKYINTTENDQDLTIPASGDIGFVVKYNQSGGFGDADIYTFVIPDEFRPEKVFSIYGKVSDEDGAPVAAIIHYFDKATGEEVAKAVSNSKDGMYSTTLPYGKEYIISIDMKGFLFTSDYLDLRPKKEESARRDYTLQKVKVGLKFELKNIYFEFGKATLTEESKTELGKLVDLLAKYPITIELGGHTDNVGSDENNKKLSQDRVNSVREFLIQRGIDKERITAVGYGEEFPIASNDTDEGRQANRRVEVKVTQVVEEKGGGEVVTQEPEVKKKEEAKFDMLAMLRYAAEIGGLPKGSPCTDENYFFKDVPWVPNTDDGEDREYGEIYSLDDYIHGGFSAHVLNYGFKNVTDGFFGAGMTFTDDEFGDYYFNYFFSGPDTYSFFGQLGSNYDWSLYWLASMNFHFRAGWEFSAFGMDYTGIASDDKFQYYANVPIGVRYLHQIAGFNLGADITYNVNVLKHKSMTSSPSYFSIGANARWGMFQGGLYINSGDVVDYFGIRAGITF